MSDQRDAIATAIREAWMQDGFNDGYTPADAVLPFVDAARAEGERRGLARAINAVKALDTFAAWGDGIGSAGDAERAQLRRADVLSVLEQQKDASDA